MHGHDLKIQTPDGDFMAYVAAPEGAAKAPVVVVIQEIFGVNAFVRGFCHELAKQGFIAAAPDIFWRQEKGVQLDPGKEAELNRGFELYKGFKLDKGVEDIAATIKTLRGHSHGNGKVGVAGFCLGGLLTYLTLTRTDADAGSAYYGGGTDNFLSESDKITKPLIMHFAEEDHFWPKSHQDEVTAHFAGSKLVTIHSYPGVDHAFARTNGAAYDKAAAEKAHQRTFEHMRKNLA